MSVILVAVDFSGASRAALDEAAVIAKREGHKIVLVHAFTQPAKGLGGADLIDPVNKLLGEMQYDEAVELSSEWAQPLREVGIDVLVESQEASPRKYVVAMMEKHSPRLVVVGHHGYGGFLLGSVAKRVLDKAKCPVLVVPDAAVGKS